jgi:hypothetical protein
MGREGAPEKRPEQLHSPKPQKFASIFAQQISKIDSGHS